MTINRRLVWCIGVLGLCGLTAWAVLHPALPFFHPPAQRRPIPTPDYYLIMDERDDRLLMYVPVVVSVGDELISEENKLYTVVKITENRAYARFLRNIELEKH